MSSIIMDKAIETSSDDDDTYTNSVARLKALKKKRLEIEKLQAAVSVPAAAPTPVLAPIPISIIVQEEAQIITDDTERIMQIKTRNRGYRGRSRGRSRHKVNDTVIIYDAIRTNGTVGTNGTVRSTRRHPPVDNLENDVEIISVEEGPNPITESCNDDVIALSSENDTSDNNACSEDDNYEIDVKVLWRSSRIDRLSICRYDSFLKIFQHYADLEKVSMDEILIMQKDKVISRTDTPASLKLSVIDILDGGIVNPGMNTLSDDKSNEDDMCNIKVQTANKKQSLTIPLKKDQRFKTLFANCAEQLGVSESKLKFYFDGEQIDPSDTPESLDLEGEACIDLHILSA